MPAFACAGCGEAHPNRGNNLLKCFECEFNLCLDCVQFQLERKQRVRRQQEESARAHLVRTVEEQTRCSMAASDDAAVLGTSPPPSYREALELV